MKLILLLVLAVLMPPTYAGRARPRLPLIWELIRKTPWQNIAAGGAAAGTVIVASKVGNGVESGLQTVARKNPDAFASCVTPLRLPFQVAFYILIGSGIVLIVRLCFRRNKR